MTTNLYAYDDILLQDIHNDREPDYIYANPSIYDIESNYKVVVNEEGSQLELLDNSNGYLRSIYVSTDMELIRHIENILEFHIKNKELKEELKYLKKVNNDLVWQRDTDEEHEAKAKAFDRIVEQRKKTGVITLGHYAWNIIKEYESGVYDA